MIRDLADDAERLRAWHGRPLVLANVWDAASARLVEELGFPAVATSSAAVAAALGAPDADALEPDAAFGAVALVAAAVSVPVTADLEAGYGLEPSVLVERLLGAGAVGCNLEDTDHHGGSVLVDAGAQAERIRAVKDAAIAAGVDVVVNARVDTYVRGLGERAEPLAEAVRRGLLYRDAGADCVYPIGVTDPGDIATLVGELGPVNVLLTPDAPPLSALRELGVARVSVGSALFRLALRHLRAAAERLLAGDDEWWAARST